MMGTDQPDRARPWQKISRSRRWMVTLACSAVCLLACGGADRAAGQIAERSTPSQAYFASFGFFYDGDFGDALDSFANEGRGAIKTVESRWIDSICYETMVGECHYHMGNLAQALEHYNAAITLYVRFSDWMLRVQFPPMIRPAAAGTVKPVPWGASSRRSRAGFYPTSMLISQGRVNNNPQYRQGGVVAPAVLYPIQVQEIVRCTTLAIRRRTELLGPICAHDPLTSQLAAALSRRPGPPNHWSEAWVNVQLGLALVAAGREAQGISALKQSLVAAGEFDHPMTSIALLELGRLALANGQLPVAAEYFEEATYAAVNYPDGGVLEEAFRYGALTHLMANRPGIYPLLPPAIEWARRKDLRYLHASLLLSLAEHYAVRGQTPKAAAALEEASRAVGVRDMGKGRLGARLNFLRALVFFQQRRVADGNAALAAAMGHMKHGSVWLFRIGLTDRLLLSGVLTPRVAMELYESLLRDPQAADWQYDPMEALAVLVTAHPASYEHWFEVALTRKAHERALEIADLARRHRFFSSLPFGGRLQALRWLLEGPPDALDAKAQLQRQDLLARYPLFAELSRQAAATSGQLKAGPLVAPDQQQFLRQGEVLGQLGAVSLQQEALLREMAVRREPADLVFPPVRSVKQIQESMPEGHALLAFFATSRHVYAFLFNRQRYAQWQVASPEAVTRGMQGMLRRMGHFAANHELSVEEIQATNWQEPAEEVLGLLVKGSPADFSQPLDELVIVPDGVLWYLPFEALQVRVDGRRRPLISRFRIRYAPTASLAFMPRPWARRPLGTTAVVVGRLDLQDDPAVAAKAAERIAEVLPGTVAVQGSPPAPTALYGTLFDRLIVLDDLVDSDVLPYAWSPAALDRGKPGSRLSDWMDLPFGGPDEIILPGLHTPAESALGRISASPAPGQEVFLAVCGLMSSGSRTLLLSRWRTGGRTAFDMVREFAQELPHTTPSDAFQRAVFLVAGSRLDLQAEPRIARSAVEEPPRAGHPFFWAGYLLIDPGTVPEPQDQVQPEPGIPPVVPPEPEAPPGADGPKADAPNGADGPNGADAPRGDAAAGLGLP